MFKAVNNRTAFLIYASGWLLLKASFSMNIETFLCHMKTKTIFNCNKENWSKDAL